MDTVVPAKQITAWDIQRNTIMPMVQFKASAFVTAVTKLVLKIAVAMRY